MGSKDEPTDGRQAEDKCSLCSNVTDLLKGVISFGTESSGPLHGMDGMRRKCFVESLALGVPLSALGLGVTYLLSNKKRMPAFPVILGNTLIGVAVGYYAYWPGCIEKKMRQKYPLSSEPWGLTEELQRKERDEVREKPTLIETIKDNKRTPYPYGVVEEVRDKLSKVKNSVEDKAIEEAEKGEKALKSVVDNYRHQLEAKRDSVSAKVKQSLEEVKEKGEEMRDNATASVKSLEKKAKAYLQSKEHDLEKRGKELEEKGMKKGKQALEKEGKELEEKGKKKGKQLEEKGEKTVEKATASVKSLEKKAETFVQNKVRDLEKGAKELAEKAKKKGKELEEKGKKKGKQALEKVEHKVKAIEEKGEESLEAKK